MNGSQMSDVNVHISRAVSDKQLTRGETFPNASIDAKVVQLP